MTSAQPAQQSPNPPDPASFAARLTAKLVDVLITAAIAFVALIFLAFLTLNVFEVRVYTDAEAYRLASPFLGALLFEAATVATTAWRGITPGKRLLGIKVVARSDSLPPTAMQAFVRWALPLVAIAPLVDAFVRDIPDFANSDEWPALSGRVWWLWVALGWWLLIHVPAVLRRDRRGWHDRAAGTVVVEAR